MNLGYKQDFNNYTLKYGINSSGFTGASAIVAIGDSDLFGTGADTGIGASIGLNISSVSTSSYHNLASQGATTNDLSGHFLNYATYFRPDILIVYTGFETDLQGGLLNTTILNNISAIDTACKALGCTMFIANGKPASSFTSGQLSQATSLKNSINSVYSNRVIDTWGTLIDSSTGLIKTTYNADGLHYNDAGVTACMVNLEAVIASYFVNSTAYISYDIETSANGTSGFTLVQTETGASAVSQTYPNSGLTTTKYYRVRAKKVDTTYDAYSNVIAVSTTRILDFVMSGGITDTQATIKSKLNYTNVPVWSNDLAVMRIQWDGTNYKGYINNILIFTSSTSTGNWAYVYNMMIGSDADSTCYLSGYVPEILVYKNELSDSDATNAEQWLADKWLITGANFNGHTVAASPGIFPTISNTKWLHFDETGYTLSGNTITAWNDSANFHNIPKVGTPLTTANRPQLQTSAFKGLSTAKFDGNQNFKVTGLSDSLDPDYYTFFLVFKLNNFDLVSDETIIGTINNSGTPTYNNAVRIKKYATDAVLSTRTRVTSGFLYGDFLKSNIYTLTLLSLLVGSQRLKYSTDPSFATSTFTASQSCYTGGNAVATYALTGLTPGTIYYAKIEVGGVLQSDVIKFRTHKSGAYSFNIIAGSCNLTASTTPTWDRIKWEDPEIFMHIGDLHYENINSIEISDYREILNRVSYADNLRALWMNTPFFYMYDNHDGTGITPDKYNIGWPTVYQYYGENFPAYPTGTSTPLTDGWFQSFKIGRVFCIVTDMRSQRDAISDTQSPTKSTLGVVQKAWVKAQLLQASLDPTIATIIWYHAVNWNVDINSEYGSSYQDGGQSWGAYDNEQKEIGSYLYNNNIQNVLMVCGDSHLQAIDDGRNSTFILDSTNTRVNNSTLPEGLKTVCMEASPFDQYNDFEGGPWQTDTPIQSGGIYPQYEQSYGKIKVIDTGQNWIQICLETWCYNKNTSTWALTHAYAYNRIAIGSFGTPPPLPKTVSSSTELSGHVQLPSTITFGTINNVISLTSPTNLIQGYNGDISGTVIIGHANTQINAYRLTDIEYIYGSYVVASDGTFTVPGSIGQGAIVLRLYNTITNLPIGIPVIASTPNISVYSDLQMELYLTTDIDYLQQVRPLSINKTYDFIFLAPVTGGKVKTILRQISTNAILATSIVRGVLPRSYKLNSGDPVLLTTFPTRDYLYDGGLALIAVVGTGNYSLADEIVNGIFLAQTTNGGMPFSANHLEPQFENAYFRTGAVAWAAYSLGYFLEKYPSSVNYGQAVTVLESVLVYLTSLIDSTRYGLLKGGSGLYTMSGTTEIFNASYIIPWVSTEHNIDTYFAFKQAGKVLSNSRYTATATVIGESIVANLYDSTNLRMFQGINSDDTKDTADALDINSWGAVFMVAIGRTDIANQLLNRIEANYYCTDVNTGATGYKPYSSTLGYPGAVDTVWFEGSFGVALAYYRVHNFSKYDSIIKELFNYVDTDGSFRYATLRDVVYEISNYESIASTAWSIISGALKDSVWL